MTNLAISQSSELKKHVNAIHCTNNLSLVQRKLFNALLYNAYKDLQYKDEFQISIKPLCQLIGYNSKDYKSVKKALLGLMTIAIEWNVIDYQSSQEKGKWQASSILASARLEGGMCTYQYSSVMKELLYQPEIYARIDINTAAKFKSTYGLALYENCVRYQKISQTQWFTMDVFRLLMGVIGNKYQEFKDFRKRVLNKALEEVNNLTPLKVTPEFKRENKTVVAIRFKIGKSKAEIEDQPDCNTEMLEVLTDTFSISPSMIEELLESYSQEYIQSKIDIILSSPGYLSGKIHNLTGMLIDALRKDYQPGNSAKAVLKKKRVQREAVEIAKEEQQSKILKDQLSDMENAVNTFLSDVTESKEVKIISRFKEYLSTKNKVIFDVMDKSGFNSPLVKTTFNEFVFKHYCQ